MDTKSVYSTGVQNRKALSQTDIELAKQISAGERRKEIFKHGWASVNINEVVEKFAPGSQPVYREGKITFTNKENTIAIVTDVGGGYLRIQDLTYTGNEPRYLDLNGNYSHNYVDSRGRTIGLSRAEFNRRTHFRIKKREEM